MGDQMKKILVIGTGGTIGSKKGDVIALHAPLKILDMYENQSVSFETHMPFSILSENMNLDYWEMLINFFDSIDFSTYQGVILLHGSDTLAYTGALLANLYYDKRLVLVAANKPPEAPDSNAKANFDEAVHHLTHCDTLGVFVSYDGISPAYSIISADSEDKFKRANVAFKPVSNPVFQKKRVLVVKSYPGIDYANYDLNGVDAVLHTMYHSATAPQNASDFYKKCKDRGIPLYFVTTKREALYESAKDFNSILFCTTLENAYARMLLTE